MVPRYPITHQVKDRFIKGVTVRLLLFSLIVLTLLASCAPTVLTSQVTPTGQAIMPAEGVKPTPTPSQEQVILQLIQTLPVDSIILQLDYEPTFSLPRYIYPFGRVPVVTLYADGRLFYQDQEYSELLLTQLTLEETAQFLTSLYDLGILNLQSYTDMCVDQPDGEQVCVADASYSIIKVLQSDGKMKEIRNYAGFGSDKETLETITRKLSGYKNTDAEDYIPEQGVLFITALDPSIVPGDSDNEFPPFPLPPPFSPPPLKPGETWAVELGPREISTFVSAQGSNSPPVSMVYENQLYQVEFVPWLPGNQFSPELQKAFPPTLMETSEQHWLSICPAEVQVPLSGANFRIVYLDQGDLYVLDEAVEKLRITQDGNVDDFILSGDGSTAYFIRKEEENDEIWGADLFTGDVFPIHRNFPPATSVSLHPVSSNNEWLPFTLNSDPQNGELWIIRTNGTDLKLLADESELRKLHPELPENFGMVPNNINWVPNTDLLIYDSLPVGDGLFIYIPENDLVDVTTGEKSDFPPGLLEFSPDGDRVIAKQVEGLILTNGDGSELQTLPVDYFSVGMGENYLYPPVIWIGNTDNIQVASPESSNIDYSHMNDTPYLISVVPVKAPSAYPMTTLSGFPGSFVFSPGGQMVSFWNSPVQSNQRSLYIAYVDGSELALYDQKELIQLLGWAPDAGHFIYAFGEDPAYQRIMLGNPCKSSDPLFEGPFPVIQWLDGKRFILEIADPESGNIQLYLGDTNLNVEPILHIENKGSSHWEAFLLP